MYFGSKPSRYATTLYVAMLAACATAPNTRVNQDPQVDLGHYKTFAFYDASGAAGQPYSTLVGARIKEATAAQLKKLGYVQGDANADLRVNIVLRVQERQDVRSTTTGLPRYRAWGGVETVNYRQGTLTIDLVDAKRNAMVWRGVIDNRVADKAAKNPGPAIDEAVTKLFAHFSEGAA
jgi:hypothetical protein